MSLKKQVVADPPSARTDNRTAPAALSDTAHDPAPQAWGMIFVLARIFYAMRSRCEDALRPYGLTPMQFTILSTLNFRPGMSSAELSRRFDVTPQTMGEMIVNLERRSLVERRQDPANRRALKLSLTEEGRRMMQTGNSTMQKVETEMFAGLSTADREELRGRLRELHDQLWLPGD